MASVTALWGYFYHKARGLSKWRGLSRFFHSFGQNKSLKIFNLRLCLRNVFSAWKWLMWKKKESPDIADENMGSKWPLCASFLGSVLVKWEKALLFYLFIWESKRKGERGGGGEMSHSFIHSLVDSCLCLDWGIKPMTLAYPGDALTSWAKQPGPSGFSTQCAVDLSREKYPGAPPPASPDISASLLTLPWFHSLKERISQKFQL